MNKLREYEIEIKEELSKVIKIKAESLVEAIGIDGELLAGSLPKKQLRIVIGWLAHHEEAAYKAWNLAVQGLHFDKIPPM